MTKPTSTTLNEASQSCFTNLRREILDQHNRTIAETQRIAFESSVANHVSQLKMHTSMLYSKGHNAQFVQQMIHQANNTWPIWTPDGIKAASQIWPMLSDEAKQSPLLSVGRITAHQQSPSPHSVLPSPHCPAAAAALPTATTDRSSTTGAARVSVSPIGGDNRPHYLQVPVPKLPQNLPKLHVQLVRLWVTKHLEEYRDLPKGPLGWSNALQQKYLKWRTLYDRVRDRAVRLRGENFEVKLHTAAVVLDRRMERSRGLTLTKIYTELRQGTARRRARRSNHNGAQVLQNPPDAPAATTHP